MKQNASSNPLLVIVRLASTASRQGQAGKRKTTAFRLVLDPRYSLVSRAQLRSRQGVATLPLRYSPSFRT